MSNLPWSLLGLEPTDDLRAVKRAYARLLKGIDAEVDPDGFQQLRGAYEHACHLAAGMAADNDGDSPPIAEERPASAPAMPETTALATTSSFLAASPLANDVALLLVDLDDPRHDKAAKRLDTLLHGAHCTLPGMRQALAEEVLRACASATRPPHAEFLEYAAVRLGWFDLFDAPEPLQAALNKIKRTWAEQHASRLSALFQPADIAPALDLLKQLQRCAWMQELSTRDHFQLALMHALLDYETPIASLDKVFELLNWNDDLRHLYLLAPSLVHTMREHYYTRHQQAHADSYESGLRHLAQETWRADKEVRARRKAAKQVLAPFAHRQARLTSMSKNTQDWARYFVNEIDARYPALQGRLDPQTLDFWRDEHPHFTQAPAFVLLFPGAVLAAAISTITTSWLPASTLTTLLMILLWATLTGLFPLALTACCQGWQRMRPRIERTSYALGLRLLPSAWHGLLDHGFSTLGWLLWSSLWGLLMVVISAFFLLDEGWTWSVVYHALLWGLVPGILLLTKAVVSWKWQTQWFPPKQYAPRPATATTTSGWNWATSIWLLIGINIVGRIIKALTE
ncbi:J domain-containing protein [Chitiniphilus eburneus]|uniref:J domain-containing protein n=1 Tax=Chitiniphilus eburneus TaxID=2571148 RepID=A0A4U0PA53_9NEIS|nr:J domain-containing protein [Chitiniphilus eburneus]TJZ64483.1 J domain-containing protein [Chitiniphilus eburneus]